MKLDELDAEGLRNLENPLVSIELLEDDAFDAGVADRLEAVPAWGRRDVDRGAVDGKTLTHFRDSGWR